MKTRATLAGLLLVTTLGAVDFKATNFHLYYGGEAKVLAELRKRLAVGHVAVVDLRALNVTERNALLTQANRIGAKVLAYVSIGELHDREAGLFETFFRQAQSRLEPTARFRSADAVEIDRNAKFKSRHMDVLSIEWQMFVLNKIANTKATGAHGIFLDTVDTVDNYISRKQWPISRRVQSVAAMQQFIRTIKARNPRQYVMMNRGLNLIDAKVSVGDAKGVKIPGLNLAKPHPKNPDAVLWENAFTSNDPWTRAKELALRTIHTAGHTTVFALGYSETGGKAETFFEQTQKEKWPAAWANSSTTLHLELTHNIP